MESSANRPVNLMPWIVPQLTVKDVDRASQFYVRAFGFTHKGTTPGQDGTSWYAELQYKDQVIILTKESIPGKISKSPQTLQNASPMNLYMYCDDVDSIFKQAVGLGAQSVAEPNDMQWGDRVGIVSDIDGYFWVIATCKHPPQEISTH